jgi:hypothetical protein
MNDPNSINTILIDPSLENRIREEKESIHKESHGDNYPSRGIDGTTMFIDPPVTDHLHLSRAESESSSMIPSPQKYLITTATDSAMNIDYSNPIPIADPLKSLAIEINVPSMNLIASAEGFQCSDTMDITCSLHPLYYVPPKAARSYRVLAECPLTIMLLLQLYPKCIKNYLPQLLPLMMETLFQRPPTYNMIPKIISLVSTSIHPLHVSTSQEIHHPLDGPMTLKIFQTRSKELFYLFK